MRPQAIFWDMDGTLTDSEPLWEEATYYLSERMGRRLTPQLRQHTVGATFETTAGILATHAGIELTQADIEHYRAMMYEHVQQLFATKLQVFPGIRELLTQLQAWDIPMLVTTNTARCIADSAISALGRDFFIHSICGDEVPQGKPAPDIYQAAAAWCSVPPEDCLVFEDSTAGMTAAVAAGCQVIGLPATAATTVPAQVVTIESLRGPGNRHLDAATAADIEQWWQQLRGK